MQATGFDGTVLDLKWLDPQQLDRADVDGAVAVLEAARVQDYPHEAVPSVRGFTANLQLGWDGDPPVSAVTRDHSGRVVGVLEVTLPRRDNKHLGFVEVTVDPVVRRQGLGTALFEAGVAYVQQQGRTVVMAEAFDLPHAQPFAKALGLDAAMDEVKRRQDLVTLDRSLLDRERAVAEAAAPDYELVRLPAEVPDELLPAVVDMLSAINDAPNEELDIEDEVFSAERYRDFRAGQAAHGRRIYQLAARHRATGVLAGHTVVGVDEQTPFYGHQYDTSVLRDHRGHRLGLLLKLGMVQWLAEAEPQLRTLDTWNTASNQHMIAVNEALGYRIVAKATAFQRHL
jgi:GNAT superfamily N-acetyltransferase